MNHPIHWLYHQFVGALPETSWRCYLCGAFCAEERYPVVKGIADTFNSHYLCKCPSSPWLCAACFWYFDSKAGHPDFRKMSLYIGRDGWEEWQRPMMKGFIRHWLQHGVPFDIYLIVSLSKKKHILLQAPMNVAETRLLAIQVEEQVAHLTLREWEKMDTCFMALLAVGHNKGEILSGNLYANTLRKHGQIMQAMKLNAELDQYRNSAALELLSYVTIIDKGEEIGRDIDTNGTGDGNHPSSGLTTQSRMESDRPRVQVEVPHGHLDASRNQRSSVRTDDEHAHALSQQSLW